MVSHPSSATPSRSGCPRSDTLTYPHQATLLLASAAIHSNSSVKYFETEIHANNLIEEVSGPNAKHDHDFSTKRYKESCQRSEPSKCVNSMKFGDIDQGEDFPLVQQLLSFHFLSSFFSILFPFNLLFPHVRYIEHFFIHKTKE